MYHTAFSFLAALALAPTVGYAMQQPATSIISSEIGISRDRAELKLELSDGRRLTLATVTGGGPFRRDISGSGDQIITLGVQRGGPIDRSWRELLNEAIEADAADLGELLVGWDAPGASALELDAALEAALSGQPLSTAGATPSFDASADELQRQRDSLAREVDRLKERAEMRADEAARARERHRGWHPIRDIVNGIAGVFSTIVAFAVLFGLGFVTIMFGGRKYIEGVADTVRAGIGRSFLVGLAGAFITFPVFILGIIVLAISIVGIPALLLWVPLFPLATILAVVLGFIGVAHAAGEIWSENRYEGAAWVSRANSYYFMAAGLTLFAALFIAASVITMAGPWLRWLNNLLNALGAFILFFSALTGFGAVLISRGGSRANGAALDGEPTYTEGAGV